MNRGLTPGYARYHKYLRKQYGRANHCSNPECITQYAKKFEWALIRGRQYSFNIDDYIQFCIPCHRKYDMTDETKKTLSKAHSGKCYHGRERSIIRISPDGTVVNYSTISEAKNENSLKTHTGIVNCLTGRAKSAAGFKWEYTSVKKAPSPKTLKKYQLL